MWNPDYATRFIRKRFDDCLSGTAVDKAATRYDRDADRRSSETGRYDHGLGLEAGARAVSDHELVELAARIPAELKVRDEGKWILKEAARQVIPSQVIDRPKGYFPVPALKYIEGPYLDYVRSASTASAPANWPVPAPMWTACWMIRRPTSPRCVVRACGRPPCWKSWLQTHQL
ncbi:MAG: asparagine synthase-related protein [Thiolinea sp.]